MPVFVSPGQVLFVGDIPLLERDARLIGTVRNQQGVGVPGVHVVGSQPEGIGWGETGTNASGVYTMSVIGGEWFVEPHPDPEMPYVFRQGPRLVQVAPGGTMTGVDLVLTSAEARIEGTALDAETLDRIWGLAGWAWAERYVEPADEFEFFSEAPLENGGFALKVRGGEQYNVGLNLHPHASYVSGGAGPGSVALGGVLTITVPLEHKDAMIEGQLIDGLTGLPPSGPIWAEVFGEDERGQWVTVGVDPDSGVYGLSVISGTWHLRAWVDPDSGYVAAATPISRSVQSGQLRFRTSRCGRSTP